MARGERRFGQVQCVEDEGGEKRKSADSDGGKEYDNGLSTVRNSKKSAQQGAHSTEGRARERAVTAVAVL